MYFSKFHDGGSYTIQRPGYPISTSYRKPSGVQLHVPVDDLNAIPNYKKNYEYMSGEDLNQSEDPNLITDTSEKLIELGENNSGVLAYLVSNPHIPGEDFLVTKAALVNSGVIYNKVVKLTSYSGRGGGKVEILNDKVFSITGAWYRGSGSADWLVGTTFPIGDNLDSIMLAPMVPGDQILKLPDQVTVSDISWLALYCRTCVQDRVVMQVYIPETLL